MTFSAIQRPDCKVRMSQKDEFLFERRWKISDIVNDRVECNVGTVDRYTDRWNKDINVY